MTPTKGVPFCAPAGEPPTMYETHFGLQRRPFPTTPDSECYYPATGHETALAQLVQALTEGEGQVVLTGEPGTGKTLLAHRLVEQLGPDAISAFLTNSHLGGRAGLLQALLYDLGLPHEGKTEQELRLALTEVLLNHYAAGQRTLVIVDEAQHLTAELLEELRLLGNLEGRGGKAVQVVLVAQSGFRETLQRPELAGFRQRIGVLAHLEPLGLHEAADYLLHHLRLAGGRPEALVTDEALEVLARGSQGVPRLLNRAAHRALAIVCEMEAAQVDAEAALEALHVLGLVDDEATEDPVSRLEREESDAAEGHAEPHSVLALAAQDGTSPAMPVQIVEAEGGRLRRLFAAPRRPA